MNTATLISIFSISIVIIAFFTIVICILTFCNYKKLNKRSGISKDENLEKWYDAKIAQLVSMFSIGLVFVTLVISFLALLPRYDYEDVKEEVKSYKKEIIALLQKQKMEYTKDMSLIKKSLNNHRTESSKRFEQLKSDNNILEKRLREEQQNYNKLAFEFQKLLLIVNDITRRQAIIENKILIPGYTPRTTAPKLDVPKLDVPKLDVPKLDVPKIVVPKIVVPKIVVPKIVVPKIVVPKMETP